MEKGPDYLPEDYDRIQVVGSLGEMFIATLTDPVNCIMVPRRLTGDFNGLARKLSDVLGPSATIGYDSQTLSMVRVENDPVLTEDEKLALTIICEDMDRIHKYFGSQARLRIIEPAVYNKPTMQFHQDGLIGFEKAHERILCPYNQETTEFLPNEGDHIRIIDKTGVVTFTPGIGVKAYSFHVGDIWRQACLYKGSSPDAFIHRAPEHDVNQPPRLLLVSTLLLPAYSPVGQTFSKDNQ